MGKKLTLEEIKERVGEINPNIEILSDKYINSKTKLRCRCKIDGNVWGATGSNLQKGKGCPKCKFNKLSKERKKNLNDIKREIKIINPNIEIISNEYVGNKNNMECKCLIDGYEWKANYVNLKRGHGCPKCYGNVKLTIQDVKNKLNLLNPNIKIISKEYINAHTNLKLVCLIDGNEWVATWNDISSRQGCPKCAIKKQTGENNCNWKGGITPLHEYLRHKINNWKKYSFKKYSFKCDITGKGNKNIIHHLYNFSNIAKETMTVLNLPIHEKINQYTEQELKSIEEKCLELHYKYGLGVCLSEEIHKEFHQKYGYVNNTKEQYEEFKKNKLKELEVA